MNFDAYRYHWALGGTATDGGLEQNRHELEMLYRFICERGIKSVLEIGMAQGHLNKFFRDAGLDVQGINPVRIEGVPHILGRSQDAEVIAQIEWYDLIFVDGDHSYDAVNADFLNYWTKCKYMAFHDILGLRDCEGVARLWGQVKERNNHVEFIAGSNPSGIGVIW
jgi:hypothetical protein